jgi:hypothetical protein
MSDFGDSQAVPGCWLNLSLDICSFGLCLIIVGLLELQHVWDTGMVDLVTGILSQFDFFDENVWSSNEFGGPKRPPK